MRNAQCTMSISNGMFVCEISGFNASCMTAVACTAVTADDGVLSSTLSRLLVAGGSSEAVLGPHADHATPGPSALVLRHACVGVTGVRVPQHCQKVVAAAGHSVGKDNYLGRNVRATVWAACTVITRGTGFWWRSDLIWSSKSSTCPEPYSKLYSSFHINYYSIWANRFRRFHYWFYVMLEL